MQVYLREMVPLANTNLQLTCSRYKNNSIFPHAYFVETYLTEWFHPMEKEPFTLIFWTSVFLHRIFSAASDDHKSSKQKIFGSLTMEK